MYRPNENQGRETQVFLDLATGEFVVREHNETTKKVQVCLPEDPERLMVVPWEHSQSVSNADFHRP